MLGRGAGGFAQNQSTASLSIRGKKFTLYTYGTRGKPPVVVTSGDGGWIHLGPHVATVLASHGYFVVGVDAKDYLSRFTTSESVLSASDVPGDYGVIVDFAATSGASDLPVLVGVSEGGGLSVLAATREDVRRKIRGVIGIGLPDITELGWRWRDTLIYLTHRPPNEPTFSTAAVIERVSPTPVAAIHSTRDEFVPLETVKVVMSRARDPKRLWVIDASDHSFSDKRTEFDANLLEAMSWIGSQKK